MFFVWRTPLAARVHGGFATQVVHGVQAVLVVKHLMAIKATAYLQTPLRRGLVVRFELGSVIDVGRSIHPAVFSKAGRRCAKTVGTPRYLVKTTACVGTQPPFVGRLPSGFKTRFYFMFRFFGDKVNDRPHRIGAVEGRGRTLHHFDTLYLINVYLV